MATTIREFLVAIGVRADDKALRRFDRDLGRVKAGLTTIVSGAIYATAAVTTVTVGLIGMAQATAVAGDEAAKAGKRTGLLAAEYQALTYAAELSGAESADVEIGLRKIAKTAHDATRGLSTATAAFADLGVKVTDDQGALKPTLDLFLETADALAQLDNDAQRAALAQEVFGRGGAKLIPLLKEGRKGIEALMQEAEDLGFTFDAEAAAATENFLDAQLRARKVLEGVRNTIGLAVIPALTRMIDRFTDWWKVNRDVIRQRLEQVADGIAQAFDRAGEVLLRVDRIVRERLGGWETILKGIGAALAALALGKFAVGVATVISGLVSLVSLLAGVIGGIGLGTFLLVILAVIVFVGELVVALWPLWAALVALYVAVDDLIVYLRGGKSALGAFLDQTEAGSRLLPTIYAAVDALTTALGSLWAMLVRVSRVVGLLLAPVFEALKRVIMAVLAPILEMIWAWVEVQALSLVANLETWIGAFEGLVAILDRVTAALQAFTGEATTAGEAWQGLQRAGRFLLRGGLSGQQGGAGAPGAGPSVAGYLAYPPPAAAGGTMTSSSNVTIEGDTVTIEGSNMTPEELARLFEDRDLAKRRQAAASLQGGDV